MNHDLSYRHHPVIQIKVMGLFFLILGLQYALEQESLIHCCHGQHSTVIANARVT